MEEEKIILDHQSFEALAVDTRIKILKSLRERRKTLSEIADEQKMSASGIKEHLETLESAGLVAKKDDGHKWKYYELTKKGAQIVAPKELRVWIMLSISLIALAGAMLAIMYSASPIGSSALTVDPLPNARNSAIPDEQMINAATLPTQPDSGAEAAMPTSGSSSETNPSVPPNAAPSNAAPPDTTPTGASSGSTQKTQTTSAATPTAAPGGNLSDQRALATYLVQSPTTENGGIGSSGNRDIMIPLVVAGVSAITLVGSLAILAMNRMKR